MADLEVRIPDIGDFADVPVIEVHVSPGDTVAAEDPLITLESDKATMDVPAPAAGTVGDVMISIGDRVSEGTPIIMLRAEGPAGRPKERVHEDAHPTPGEPAGYGSASGVYDRIEVTVPDIGDFADVPVIEVHVAEGDTVAAEDPLITLESDKATMDVPAPVAGTVTAVKVSVGDTVSEGHPIVDLRIGERETPAPAPAPRPPSTAPGPAATPPRSGQPTSASGWSWSTGGPRWAASASTSAASRPRRCCMRPGCSRRPGRWPTTAWCSARRRSTSTGCAAGRTASSGGSPAGWPAWPGNARSPRSAAAAGSARRTTSRSPARTARSRRSASTRRSSPPARNRCGCRSSRRTTRG